MALDTRDRRASAIAVGLPWRGLLPRPDVGAEDQGDRQHVAGYYRGVLAASPEPPFAYVLWTAVTMRQSQAGVMTARGPGAGTLTARQPMAAGLTERLAGVGTPSARYPSFGTLAILDED